MIENVYSKLQKIRKELKDLGLKKTGINRYKDKKTNEWVEKFRFYELADFLPSIIDLFNEHKLFSYINFYPDHAILTIIESSVPEVKIEFYCTVEDAELLSSTKIQELGATQTYLRRYLYINALDIIEKEIKPERTIEEEIEEAKMEREHEEAKKQKELKELEELESLKKEVRNNIIELYGKDNYVKELEKLTQFEAAGKTVAGIKTLEGCNKRRVIFLSHKLKNLKREKERKVKSTL